MKRFELSRDLFIYPTPNGVYYTVSSKEIDKPREFLRSLLNQQRTPELNHENLHRLMGDKNEQKCLDLLFRCQQSGWVQGLKEPLSYLEGSLSEILPGLLTNLSETGKVLLADQQGFYLSSQGFPHEVAEELSALSAEIATVHDRRSGLLLNNLRLGSHAWSVVDIFGNSQIGFWPLFIGKSRFVLIMSGIPHFNQPEFVSLVWALTVRYSGQNT